MTIESQAALITKQHKEIEALATIEEVAAYADRVNASGYEAHISDELLHHLERRRVELLRKSGAFCP